MLARADKPFRDRIGDYLPYACPVGVDLFPYTVAELERLRLERPSWRAAIVSGVEIGPAPAPASG